MQKVRISLKELCTLSPTLTEPYLHNTISRARKAACKEWAHIKDKKQVYVYYNSIPQAVKEKHNLPIDEATLLQLREDMQAGAAAASYNQTAISEECYNGLYLAAKQNFSEQSRTIRDKYVMPLVKVTELAQKWAAWQWILDSTSNFLYSVSELYNAYNRLFPGDIATISSFYVHLSKCKKVGAEKKVIDGRYITKASKRISSFQYEFIKTLYMQPQKYTAAEIHRKLTAACAGISENPYSKKSVFNYMTEFEKDPLLYAARYGEAAAQRVKPHLTLLPAEHINTQWQADGWTLPFWGNKFKRYVLYCVWDNHSRKIVGYSIGESENTGVILEALENAIRNTGYLPAELITDKHSFTKTEIAQAFKANYTALGGIWTVTINAQRNSIAERGTQYLDSLCKDLRGYLGKNVNSRGKNSRPGQEALAELSKSKNWLTEDEIKACAVYIVNEYNKTQRDQLGGLSPNEKYAASTSAKAIAVTDDERAILIRPVKKYKISRGQIVIKQGVTKYEYIVPAEIAAKLKGAYVNVVTEDYQSGIYLLDIRTGEMLGTANLKPQVRGAIADQTEADKKLLRQSKAVKNITTRQAKKNRLQTVSEALAENPDAINLINSHALPKDIRQIAIQHSELRKGLNEATVRVNLMPLRKTEPVLKMPEKSLRSPFAVPVTDELKKVSIEDFIKPNNQ